MCCNQGKKQGCQKPENLTDAPRNCSPEQNRKCHGDIAAKDHPCTRPSEAK